MKATLSVPASRPGIRHSTWTRRLQSCRRAGVPFIVWLAFLVPLLRHDSNAPVIGPYSLKYAGVLLGYIAIPFLALAWIALAPATLGKPLQRARALPSQRAALASHVVALLGIIGLHLALLGTVLPKSLLRGDEPYMHVDYGHHFHQVVAACAFLAKGAWSGYDPSFCAGYPAGTITDVDMKAAEGVVFLLDRLGVPLHVGFRLDLLGKFLLAPLLLYLAAWCWGLSPPWRLAALAVGVTAWHVDPLLREFNNAGMYNFVFACYLAPLVLALLERWMKFGRTLDIVLFGITGTVLTLVHLLGPVIVLLPCLLLAARGWLHGRGRPLLGLGLAVVGIVALNLSWVREAWPHLDLALPADTLHQTDLPTFLDARLNLGLPALLWIVGMIGAFKLCDVATRSLLVWNALMSIAGSGYPVIDQIEPGRFAAALTTGSILPALALARTMARRAELPRSAAVAVGLIVVGFLLVKPAVAPFEPAADHWQVTRQRLGAWLQERTIEGSRILYEDRSPWALDPAAVRWYAEREFIGGPFSYLNIEHRFAGAATYKGRLFDTPIAALREADWLQAIRAYNIGYVLAIEDELQNALGRYPALFVRLDAFEILDPVETTALRPAVLYEVRRPGPGRLIEGDADVRASFDRIEVRQATLGRVVLPYHWMDGLDIRPELPVEPVYFWRDPVPFIGVTNGTVRDFEIVWNSE